MQIQTTSEKTYTVSYFKPGQKNSYGLSVSVSGDKKKKTLTEAKELLEQAQVDAIEIYTKYNTGEPEPEK